MDILAHALWGLIVFYQFGLNPWLIVIFSLVPDLAAFSAEFVKFLFGHKKPPKNREEARKMIPKYTEKIYDYTHSLVLVGGLFIILFFTFRNASYYILPWILHIIIDIPSHSRDFFGTPILFPISNFKFNGWEWGKKKFMIINYSLIIIVGSLVFLL